MSVPELRITVVVGTDPSSGHVTVQALGASPMLPAPITAPTFEEAWALFADALSAFRAEQADPKRQRGPLG